MAAGPVLVLKWSIAQVLISTLRDRDLPVREFKLEPKFGDLTFLRAAASVTLDAVGLSGIARQLGIGQALEQFNLDGMLALWRPAGSN